MPVAFVCDHCQYQQPVDPVYVGKLVNCPKCRQQSRVAPIAIPAAPQQPMPPEVAATVLVSQQTVNHFTAIAMSDENERRDSLVSMGRTMFYIGLLTILAYSFLFDTTVRTRAGDVGPQTFNIGLLNQQLSGVIVGAALTVCGSLMMGVSGRPIRRIDQVALCVFVAIYVSLAFLGFKIDAITAG